MQLACCPQLLARNNSAATYLLRRRRLSVYMTVWADISLHVRLSVYMILRRAFVLACVFRTSCPDTEDKTTNAQTNDICCNISIRSNAFTPVIRTNTVYSKPTMELHEVAALRRMARRIRLRTRGLVGLSGDWYVRPLARNVESDGLWPGIAARHRATCRSRPTSQETWDWGGVSACA
jgi:hypothetical protein